MSVKRPFRYVITGIGPITALGIGKESLWDSIIKKKLGVEQVSISVEDNEWERYYIHKVNNFRINEFGLDNQILDSIRSWKGGEHNRDLLFFLGAIKLALDDSNIKYEKEKVALVATHENLGIEQFLWKTFNKSFEIFRKNKRLSKIDYFDELYNRIVKLGYETQSFMSLYHIAKIFNIHHYSIFNNNACASGQFALEIAKDIILSEKSKIVIIVAGDCPDVFKYRWFKKLGMYPIDGRTKPFDKNRNGFLLGEGAVSLILEDFDHAIKRKAKIYAEYLGAGFRMESWGITTPKIGYDYYHKTILEAIKNSNISKNEISLICAHGVATPVNDYYEAKAITEVFKAQNIPVTALKPFVGHNLGGSSLMEIAILLLAMQNSYIPPILNTNCVDEKLSINLVLKEMWQEIPIVMKLSCAFAGYNAATILRKVG